MDSRCFCLLFIVQQQRRGGLEEAREQPPTVAVVSLSEHRDSAHFLSNKTSNSRNIAFVKRKL